MITMLLLTVFHLLFNPCSLLKLPSLATMPTHNAHTNNIIDTLGGVFTFIAASDFLSGSSSVSESRLAQREHISAERWTRV